ncbi:MAG: insulinase family protein, partial [Alphaproteobacteria bacterium]|nr:insulinase family protein [Alphaproteobacteria bacterium]
MTRLLLLAALALPACKKSGGPDGPVSAELPGGMRLLEAVEGKPGDIVIPYRKLELPNGLTVILHPDDSDPLVHVDVTYHVGSAREEVGRSGFAHFFEHMMFQGSEHVADEEHFKIITEAGGTLNGTTNTDRTNYFETVPSNQLEKMLWLEADRMGFLLDAVTQEKFEVQRETVKNERGQRVDNAPYGRSWERLGEAMFPAGHPYSWTTIGYIEDLNRADLDDLKRFFLRWYGPNNAVLTIGGRFDEDEVLGWVSKYFGPIPRGPEVEPAAPQRVTLDADRYISFEDRVALPMLNMQWPTVHARHPDEAPLDVLMAILGTGKTSLLYKNLVKEGLAVQARAGHGCRELHCEFSLVAFANPEKIGSLAEVEAVMRKSLEEFESRGVLDDDLQRVKQGIVADMVFGLESVSSKVSSLAAYETFTGDANYIARDIQRYQDVTKEDVQRVYDTYIKGRHAVVLSVVPNGKPDLVAHADTFERPVRDIPEKGEAGELAMRRPTDTFDRGVRPEAGPNPTLTVPTTWRKELANGITVLGAANDETPTTAIRIRIAAGQKHEPLAKLGLATLTAAMLDEATAKSSNEELANRLEKLGSSIDIESGDSATEITIRSLTSELDATLAIAAERLLQPAFAEEDFARVKDQVLQAIESARTEPSTTASEVSRKLLFGEDNAFAHADLGTPETVQAITLDDVKAFYATGFVAGATTMVAVSDLAADDLIGRFAAFGSLKAGDAPDTEILAFPDLAAGTLYLIDKPGAAQSQIRIGKRAMPRDFTGEFYKANLMNYALGGAFNSRININLREDKGYTYGARAFFGGDQDVGYYVASAGVRTDATKESVVEFFKEIQGFYDDGITAEELAFTKSSIGQRDALKYETPSR